jgi:hypothetical protein
MSYQDLIVAWHGAPVGGRCVNPYDPEADYPEHREDEARERDPLFDRHPDDFGEHQLAPLDRQVFEDCRKVQGKVVGRHEAVVRTPESFLPRRPDHWYPMGLSAFSQSP